eukprot:TRINITY_DN2403_c0_g1_i3.p3 TRINITY_DN2403_c0_g1~~TRINITY_DN2403_c0_g1_i3.p3  ORF type:complete len:190 (+),score=19.34 TRINITY_DN2403_c0_g1_i3:1816-2385(+)
MCRGGDLTRMSAEEGAEEVLLVELGDDSHGGDLSESATVANTSALLPPKLDARRSPSPFDLSFRREAGANTPPTPEEDTDGSELALSSPRGRWGLTASSPNIRKNASAYNLRRGASKRSRLGNSVAGDVDVEASAASLIEKKTSARYLGRVPQRAVSPPSGAMPRALRRHISLTRGVPMRGSLQRPVSP